MPKGDPLCTWCARALAIVVKAKRKNKPKPCRYCDRLTQHRQEEET